VVKYHSNSGKRGQSGSRYFCAYIQAGRRMKLKITIRNISEATAQALSEKARKAGMSRQEYLLNYLNRLAMVDAYREEREEYATLVKNMGAIVGNNTEQLQRVIVVLDDLLEQVEEMRDGRK